MNERLNELASKYRYRSSAENAVERIQTILSHRLAESVTKKDLIRAFNVNRLPDQVISRRLSDLDDLLDFYSILEIAYSANYLAGDLDEFREEAIEILELGATRIYIFEQYKSILPLQFLTRIQNQNSINENLEKSNDIYPVFLKFLMIYEFTQAEDNLVSFMTLSNIELQRYLDSINNAQAGIESIQGYLEGALTENNARKGIEIIQEYLEGVLTEGFVYYLDFITLFVELIDDTKNFNSLKADITQFALKWFTVNELRNDKLSIMEDFFYRLRRKNELSDLSGKEVIEELKSIQKLERKLIRIKVHMSQATSATYA